MKITAVKTYLCNCFRTNWVFIKIETDASCSYQHMPEDMDCELGILPWNNIRRSEFQH